MGAASCSERFKGSEVERDRKLTLRVRISLDEGTRTEDQAQDQTRDQADSVTDTDWPVNWVVTAVSLQQSR